MSMRLHTTEMDLRDRPAASMRLTQSGGGNKILALKPVAWWRGEDNALDSAGTNDGTWSGTEAYADGVVGRAFDFDGSSWVDTGSSTIGDGLFAASDRRWSVSVWAKVAYNASGVVVVRGSSAVSTRTFHLHFAGSALATAVPAVALRGALTATGLNLDDGQWHQHAVTWDGTTARYYSDGVFRQDLNVGTADEETAQRVIIGARDNGVAFRITGQIDEPLIFNRALSDSEITVLADPANYRGGK